MCDAYAGLSHWLDRCDGWRRSRLYLPETAIFTRLRMKVVVSLRFGTFDVVTLECAHAPPISVQPEVAFFAYAHCVAGRRVCTLPSYRTCGKGGNLPRKSREANDLV